jgi:hypothetical protein
MLNQPTIEKLHTMKLYGMADAFRAQIEIADASQLGFEERFGMLVDQQWLWKENRALARRLQSARLKERGAKTLIISIRAGLTASSCARCRQANGCGRIRTFCSLDRLESARAGSHALWPKKPAATAFRSCTKELPSFSANWPCLTSTAALGECC